MICPEVAHAVIAAESGKPKGLLRAQQCTGDFNLLEIWVIPPCTEIKSFHRKRSIYLKLRGCRRHWGAWIADIHPFTERTDCMDLPWRQYLSVNETSTITALLMPASENWQLQPLKSVHNYRGVNSAAWSHILMTFPNWEMCSAKITLFSVTFALIIIHGKKKKRSISLLFSVLFSTTCFLLCSKKDLQAPVSHCLVWGLTSQEQTGLFQATWERSVPLPPCFSCQMELILN